MIMPVDPPRTRWALVGYGGGGRIYHLPLLLSCPRLPLVAVVTSDPGRRAQVAQALPWVQVVGQLADLPGLGVQGVTISTPPATHADLAHRALDLGLHVVLDKPFALTADSAKALAAHAGAAGRLLIPYQNRRWDSDFRTVQALMASGALGRVHRFTSRLDRFRPVKTGWAGGTPQDGAGILLDLGPHLIDQATLLFGRAESVTAELSTLRPGAAAEDDMQVCLLHSSGVRSTLVASMAAPAAGPRLQINGSTAGFVINGFDGQEQLLKDGAKPALLGDTWGTEPPWTYGTLSTAAGTSPVVSERGRWDLFYPAVAAAAAGDAPAPVDPADAVHTAEIIDAARVSAQLRRTVDLPPAPSDPPVALG